MSYRHHRPDLYKAPVWTAELDEERNRNRELTECMQLRTDAARISLLGDSARWALGGGCYWKRDPKPEH